MIRGLGATPGPGISSPDAWKGPVGECRRRDCRLVYAPAAPDAGLRIGERVQVELPMRAAQRALVVPDAALLYDLHGGTWVYEHSATTPIPAGGSKSADKPAAKRSSPAGCVKGRTS